MMGPLKVGSLVGLTAIAMVHVVNSGVHHMAAKTAPKPPAFHLSVSQRTVLVGPQVPADVILALLRSAPQSRVVMFSNTPRSATVMKRSEQSRRASSRRGKRWQRRA